MGDKTVDSHEVALSIEEIDMGDAEIQAFSLVPATFVNRFYIATAKNVVRIGFAERFTEEEPPIFRTAVAMLDGDAQSLAVTLLSVMSKAGLLPQMTLRVEGDGKVAVDVDAM